MKLTRYLVALLCLMCVFEATPCTATLAEDELPKEIQAYFASSEFKNCVITDTAMMADHGTDNCWFVLMKRANGENVLYAFKVKNGAWKHWMHTSNAVPQGKNRVEIAVLYSARDAQTDKEFDDTVLHVYQLDKENEYPETSAIYLWESATWKLIRLQSYVPNYSMSLDDGKISYFEDIESLKVVGTAYGDVQCDIRYVSLSALPKTLKEAREADQSAVAALFQGTERQEDPICRRTQLRGVFRAERGLHSRRQRQGHRLDERLDSGVRQGRRLDIDSILD